MTKNTEERSTQTAASELFTFAQESGAHPKLKDALGSYQSSAWGAFNELPLPTTKDEAWRRTDLRKVPFDTFRLPTESDNPSPIPAELIAGEYGGQIKMTTVGAEVSLNAEIAQKGVIFTDLQTAAASNPELLKKLIGAVVRPEDGKFAALAAAYLQNGVLLYVPRGVQVELPLHSLLWGASDELAHFSHLIIHVGEGASVTYVHEAASPDGEAPTLHAGIVEINLEAGANLRFVEMQNWGKNLWNFTHERAKVGRDANLDWIFGAMGSRFTKNFTDLDHVGEGAASQMHACYFTDGEQHFDHDTQQNHHVRNTSSNLLFKGVLKDNSRSVWQGMVYVAPNAQKTDGYQASRSLILSEEARADSIPGLEIAADDVRCSHGATIGKIDAEPLFYLLSRGIPQKDAERLIVEGFFDPVIQRIPLDGLRERLQSAIAQKIAE